MLRNRRTIIFTLVFPAAMFFASAVQRRPTSASAAATSRRTSWSRWRCTAPRSPRRRAARWSRVERSLGWSRQLRLTPLNPVVYILVKALVALVMGAIAITVVNIAGSSRASRRCRRTSGSPARSSPWLCTLTFAALGVFVGYVVPGENAMQILGPGLAADVLPGRRLHPAHADTAVWHVAVCTPMYGVAEVARVAADPRAAVVRRRQRGGLVRGVRGRRRLADEQGHCPGLTRA